MKYTETNRKEPSDRIASHDVQSLFGINSRIGNGLDTVFGELHNQGIELGDVQLSGLREISENVLDMFTATTPEKLLAIIAEQNQAIMADMNSLEIGDQKSIEGITQFNAYLETQEAKDRMASLIDIMTVEKAKIKPLSNASGEEAPQSIFGFGDMLAVTADGMRMPVPGKDKKVDQAQVAMESSFEQTLAQVGNYIKNLVVPVRNYTKAEWQRLEADPKKKQKAEQFSGIAWTSKISALLLYIVSTKYLASGISSGISNIAGNDTTGAILTVVAASGGALLAGTAWQLAEKSMMSALVAKDEEGERVVHPGITGSILVGMLLADAAMIGLGIGFIDDLSVFRAVRDGFATLGPTDMSKLQSILVIKGALMALGSAGAEVLDMVSHAFGDAVDDIFKKTRRTSVQSTTPQQPVRPVMPTPPNAPNAPAGPSFPPYYHPAGGPTAPKPPGL